jgi:hypothetical protein
MKDRKIKQVLSGSGYSGKAEDIGKGEEGWTWLMYFCIHVWKQNNETCWNFSKNREGGWGRTMKGVNLLWYVAITSVHAIMCPSVQQLHAN